MKYLLSIFFLLLFFVQQAEAQVPGYQGKQLYVSYELIPHFFIYSFDKSGNVKNPPIAIRFSNETSINYVINRSSILSADISFRPDRLSTSRYDENTFDYVEKFFRTQSRIIGVGIKHMNFTRKGFIAPVGNFIQLRGFLINTKATPYGQPNAVTKISTGPTQTYNDFGITLAWGFQTVWWARLVPSYTIGLSYIVTNRNFISWLEDDYSADRKISNHGLGGILPGLLFTGKLGIGILLF